MSGERKIEVRSRTGAPYSRAGHRWGSGWQDLPKELLKDEGKMQQLAIDPHLEIRVDGVYETGPRKGQRAQRSEDDVSASAATPTGPSPEDFEALQKHAEELEEHAEELAKQLADMRTTFEKDKAAFAQKGQAAVSAIAAVAAALSLPETADQNAILAEIGKLKAAPTASSSVAGPSVPPDARSKSK